MGGETAFNFCQTKRNCASRLTLLLYCAVAKLNFGLGEWCNETAVIAIMYYLDHAVFSAFQTGSFNKLIYFKMHVSDYLSHA